MANKRITVNQSLRQAIRGVVSDALGLHDVEELGVGAGYGELFTHGPDNWTEFENQVCDFLSRKESEILNGIYGVVGLDNEVSFSESKERVASTQAAAELKNIKERVQMATNILIAAGKPYNAGNEANLIESALRKLAGNNNL